MTPLPPNSTIGILGGGQLGRMTALAAANLGYLTHIYAPEADSPAFDVTRFYTCAAYDDLPALAAFASSVDVITLEFENIPIATLEYVQRFKPVYPQPTCVEVTQDRLLEKQFAHSQGCNTAPFMPVNSAEDLAAALQQLSGGILKTRRMGYDGKGQWRLTGDEDPAMLWWNIQQPCILEGLVDFACEVSVIAARGIDGTVVCFPVTENAHRQQVLHTSTVPASISTATAQAAIAAATRLINALQLVGLLAVEMFVSRSGDVLINELAPRPHNSGHWTMEACQTSQFEQLVRACTGLPLGDTGLLTASAVMQNLLGDDATHAPLLQNPNARLHLYGKTESKPGRKMGHVTFLTAQHR